MRRAAPIPARLAVAHAAAVVLGLGAAGCATSSSEVRPGGTVRVVGGERVVGRYVSASAYEHYLRSQLASDEGRLEDAVLELASAITSDGSSAYLRTRLAEQLLGLGRLEAARDSAETALRFDPRFADARVVLGRLAARAGDHAAAEAHYRAAIEFDRGCEEAWLALAQLYRERGEPREADAALESMAQRLPDSPAAHRALSRSALARGDLQAAEQELRAALRLEPGAPRILVELGRVLLAAGHPTEAEHELRRALERSGGEPRVAEVLVQALVSLGREAEADAVIDGLDDRPGVLERRLAVGWLLLGRGRLARALTLCDEIGRGDLATAGTTPGDPRLHLLRGAVLAALGRTDEAVATLERVPAGSPDYLAARLRQGRALGDDGRFKEAVERLERWRDPVVDSGGSDGGGDGGEGADRVAALLSELHERAGDRAGALRLLTDAQARRPRSDVLAYAIGGLLDRGGEPDRAVEVVRAILERNPDHAESLNFIGWSFADRGVRLREAQGYLERAHALRPTSGEIADSLGWLYLKLDRTDDAVRLLEQASRLAPQAAEILAHLGEGYLRRGDRARAGDAFRRALTRKPDARVSRLVEERLRELDADRVGVR